MDSFSPITNPSNKIKILVSGDRNWNNWKRVSEILDPHRDNLSEIIHGGARGADTIAAVWAMRRNIYGRLFKADWEKAGKAAGPIRNTKMLKNGKPDLVIAFHNNLEESKGTKHMVLIATKAGVPVEVYSERHRYTEEEIAEAIQEATR